MDLKLVVTALVFGAMATDAGPAASPTPLAALPWLHGLAAATFVDTPIAHELDEPDPELGCAASAYQALELVADVAPTRGDETVVASFAGGIVIRDREGQLVAADPGYDCAGSADEVTTLAAGSAGVDRMIVLAVTRGGHHERTTALALFRVFGDRVDAVFTGDVEAWQGDEVRRGGVWLFPAGLLYQRPGGGMSIWVFDPVGHAYVYRASLTRGDGPVHVPPMI